MSADNWAICPKCNAAQIAAQDKKKKAAEKSYGKVEAAEYLRLIQEASAQEELQPTLREDYELGVGSDGKFYVVFKAYCNCGFGFGFEHEENTLKPTT